MPKHPAHRPRHHAHEHGHEHARAHRHDRGWTGFLRYASMLPRMWRSPTNTAVVAEVDPRPGERVLEIGAGMGAAMIVAAHSGAFVQAVDPTPYMRRILWFRRLLQNRRGRILVSAGAAEAIPAADAGVDAVWSVNTMHHWSDLDRALCEIHRVLRSGGRVLLVDEDFDDPAHPEHAKFHQKRAKHGHGFEDIVPADMAAKLTRLGFVAAAGSLEKVAGRPAKVVRGIKG